MKLDQGPQEGNGGRGRTCIKSKQKEDSGNGRPQRRRKMGNGRPQSRRKTLGIGDPQHRKGMGRERETKKNLFKKRSIKRHNSV